MMELLHFQNAGGIHHRSVAEYLAAERLKKLRDRGMPFRALRRLIFANTKGNTIVRPSKRPIAGWLALAEGGIFEMLRDNEPAVLLDEGDPESLTQSQRIQALRAYVKRYGQGGWRRLTVPYIQLHRFATAELAGVVTELWDRGIENPDVREIILYLIEVGRIDACSDIARRVAHDDQASADERMIAIDAMVAIRDSGLKDIASDVAAADAAWPQKIAVGAVLRLFPRDISIGQLCLTLRWMKRGKRGVDDLSWRLPRLILNAKLNPPSLEALRDGLVELLADGLHWREEWPHLICDRSHLSGALAATCVQGLNGSRNDGWLHASALALRIDDREYDSNEVYKRLRERLSNLAADKNTRLFWVDDALMQSFHPIADPWQRFANIALLNGPVELRIERDLKWIKGALGDTKRPTDDRAMILQAAMYLLSNSEQYRDHVLVLKPLVADKQSLISAIDEWLKPSKHETKHDRWKKKAAQRKKQNEQRNAETKAHWIKFWREVANHPESAFSTERGWKTAWNLWSAITHDGEDSHESGWNRHFIEKHFGKDKADRFRRILMNIWRQEHPTVPSERPEGERNTSLRRWQLGLAALYAEAEDPSWAAKLTEEEANLAMRYAFLQLNGLPNWMESFAAAHPGAVDAILGNELTWELNRDPRTHGQSMLLQIISDTPEAVAKLFLPRLREWLDQQREIADEVSDVNGTTAERLRRVIGAMLKHGDEHTRARMLALACEQLQKELSEELEYVWLPTLMRLDPNLGVPTLEYQLGTIEPGAHSAAVKWFGVLFGDRNDAINLKNPEFTPQLLLRLLRLAYTHIRPVDDVKHESAYSPDSRYYAERARNAIVGVLLEAKGEEGWAAKLEMASDPLCAHFKDRILAVAEENWAREIDSVAFEEAQSVALDKSGEAPASTNEAMFTIMRDRLIDLDELLVREVSPRDAWAGINDEKVMRREIARELSHAAKGLYNVDQESATGDEKKTDIRLRSVVSDHEAVIELKLADGRSARDLRDTIYEQLVKKYMAAETSRSGCLLVTLAKTRKWEHPDSGTRITLKELVSLLREEAKRVEDMMSDNVAIYVHFLDLRPRLPVESNMLR